MPLPVTDFDPTALTAGAQAHLDATPAATTMPRCPGQYLQFDQWLLASGRIMQQQAVLKLDTVTLTVRSPS
jgi:hypothetical protein